MDPREDVTRRPYHSRLLVEEVLRTRWEEFRQSDDRLAFYEGAHPDVSVVLVTYGRVELTLECLRRLESVQRCVELIVVDNASPDLTGELLERLSGAQVVRNSQNHGFLRGANAGAALAKAPALLFLNTDALLHPGAVETALEKLTSAVGVVGARLIYADGTLQEAGAKIFDGGTTTYPHGRELSPNHPNVLRDRSVDYCSGCFLLTRTVLFRRLGGFDERFAPGYYEDADYCIRVRHAAYDVLYAADVTVTHLEGASAKEGEREELMRRNGLVFRKLHERWRSLDRQVRVLIVDDKLPSDTEGSGYPRTIELVRACAELGYNVTLFGMNGPPNPPRAAGLPEKSVSFVAASRAGPLRAFLEANEFDLVWVSRPHNMKAASPALAGRCVVYDAEALFAMRDLLHAKLFGGDVRKAERSIQAELALGAEVAPVVSCVTEDEAERFRERGRHAYVVSHTTDGASLPLKRRKGVVWVGGVSPGVPNEDALCWYLDEVRPLLEERDDLLVIGSPGHLKRRPGVKFAGTLSAKRLRNTLARARCMIVPMRWAAGIPLKGVTGMAHGLPLVATQLAASQLRLPEAALVSDDPHEFARYIDRLLTDDALWEEQHRMVREIVQSRFTRDVFRRSVETVITIALVLHTRGGPRSSPRTVVPRPRLQAFSAGMPKVASRKRSVPQRRRRFGNGRGEPSVVVQRPAVQGPRTGHRFTPVVRRVKLRPR